MAWVVKCTKNKSREILYTNLNGAFCAKIENAREYAYKSDAQVSANWHNETYPQLIHCEAIRLPTRQRK